jgi:hypothetical protein
MLLSHCHRKLPNSLNLAERDLAVAGGRIGTWEKPSEDSKMTVG